VGKNNRRLKGRHRQPTERYAPSALDEARQRAERYVERHTPWSGHDGDDGDDDDDGAEHHADVYAYTVRDDEGEIRLDRFLAERSQGAWSREYLKELGIDGRVLVDGSTTKPSRALRPGQVVELTVPPPTAIEVLPEPIPLQVHYEDEHLLVAFKPRGMLTHPLGRQQSGTFVNALLHHCGDSLGGIAGSLRPGIVHRLDRVTSGLLAVAKTAPAHYALQELFRSRQVDKRYLALVEGRPADRRGLVDAPLGRHPQERTTFRVDIDGRPSQTSYRRWRCYGPFTLVELVLHTGRTHQIRVHMRFIGHPVVGDTLYGARAVDGLDDGIALHAWSLGFRHPITGHDVLCRAPLPTDMADLARRELFRP